MDPEAAAGVVSTLPSDAPRRLLVRGVNWLGDAVMSTPALVRLRERFPDAHLALLTPAKLADLWTHHPAVDEVIPFNAGDGVLAIAARLRAGEFDTALALPNSHRSALELWRAAIPRRFGLRAPWRAWFLTDPIPPLPAAVRMVKPTVATLRRRLATGQAPVPPPAGAHHLFHYLHLAAALGAHPEPCAPRIMVRPDEIAAARAAFGLAPDTPWLALNPGAEYGPAKRWPPNRFAQVATAVSRQAQVRCVLLGGPTDRGLTEEIESELRRALPPPSAPINLAGRTTLRELCAVLGACQLLLTNDTGPMHLGAALGLPVVALFGSTSPELTGPGLPGDVRHRVMRHPVPCAPCFLRTCPLDLRCLRGIETMAVAEAVLGAIARR